MAAPAEPTLTDELLADLEDLDQDANASDESGDEGGDAMDTDEGPAAEGSGTTLDLPDLSNQEVTDVAKVMGSRTAQEVLKKLDEALARPPPSVVGAIEQHPEYKLILQCNKLSVDIENDVVVVHKYIRDNYSKKFPELDSLVINPVDYARTVKALGNTTDPASVDLSFLPSATVMVVTVTASGRSEDRLLTEAELARAFAGCDMLLQLDDMRRKIVAFIESRMSTIAPNLTVMLGAAPAAKLMATAGGLTALSKMPACNIQVLGQVKRSLTGFSSAQTNQHIGFVFNAPLVQSTPLDYRKKAARVLSSKCALAARVDAFGQAPDGSVGRKYVEEVQQKVEKWQELPVGRQAKALPVPDEPHKKKRGGRRARKMKERYGVTEMRKQANRMAFGVAEEEIIVGDSIRGLGMLTAQESGKVRAAVAEARTKLPAKKAPQVKSYGGRSVSGLASSLVFTPVAGLELPTPQAAPDTSAGDKWFASNKGFARVGTSSMPPPSTPMSAYKQP